MTDKVNQRETLIAQQLYGVPLAYLARGQQNDIGNLVKFLEENLEEFFPVQIAKIRRQAFLDASEHSEL